MTTTSLCCGQLEKLVTAENLPLFYSPRVREWGLRILTFPPGETFDWGTPGVAQGIAYCPFCGSELPKSLRDNLCDELERLGLEDLLFDPDKLPEKFRSDEWWRETQEQPKAADQRTEPPDGAEPKDQAIHDCQSGWLWYHVHDPTTPFFYDPSVREWGIAILPTQILDEKWANDVALHVVSNCPWCGAKFPTSLRAERHERLAEININPAEDEVPKPYTSDQWWREAGL